MASFLRILILVAAGLGSFYYYQMSLGFRVSNQTRRELQVAVMHWVKHTVRPGQEKKEPGQWITEGWTAVKPGQTATVYQGAQEKVYLHVHYTGSVDYFVPGKHFGQTGSYIHKQPFVVERPLEAKGSTFRKWPTVALNGSEIGAMRLSEMKAKGFYWEDRFYSVEAKGELVIAY